MTIKKYKYIRLIVISFLAILVSQSIIFRNYLLPIIGIVLSSSLLFYLRSKLKNEFLADERDYKIGGDAARWAIQIFNTFAVIVMIILYAQQDLNPSFLPIATTLAYSVCFLMILYSLIFRYLDKATFAKNRKLYIIIGIVLILMVAFSGLKLFSAEDNWICQNGQWVQHGHPAFPAPSVACTK